MLFGMKTFVMGLDLHWSTFLGARLVVKGPALTWLGRTRKSAKCDSVWGLSFLVS